MDKNRLIMQNLMTDEVPWHRMTTAYGRATKFTEYFKSLYDMSDIQQLENTDLDKAARKLQELLLKRHKTFC